MKYRTSLAIVVAATAIASAARAEFAPGNLAYIQGIAGPENGYTYWGSNINGQYHALGATAQQYQDSFASNYFVSVTSWVTSSTSVTFSFDFSQYGPGQYSLHALEIIGLKEDGTIASVSSSQGFAYVQDGNKIRWDGTGASLATDPKLVLTIEQTPAPGALALLGLAGAMGTRRRRS